MSKYLHTDCGNLPEGFEDPAQNLRHTGRRPDDESDRLHYEAMKGFPQYIEDADQMRYKISQNKHNLVIWRKKSNT